MVGSQQKMAWSPFPLPRLLHSSLLEQIACKCPFIGINCKNESDPEITEADLNDDIDVEIDIALDVQNYSSNFNTFLIT